MNGGSSCQFRSFALHSQIGGKQHECSHFPWEKVPLRSLWITRIWPRIIHLTHLNLSLPISQSLICLSRSLSLSLGSSKVFHELLGNPTRKLYLKTHTHTNICMQVTALSHTPLINQSDLLIGFPWLRDFRTPINCEVKAGCPKSVTGGFDKVTERLIWLWRSLQPPGGGEPPFFHS